MSHRSRTTPRPFGPPAASASRPIAAAVAALLGLVTALVGIPLSATAAPVIVYTQTFASAPTTGWTSGGQPWAAAGGKYTADASGFTNLVDTCDSLERVTQRVNGVLALITDAAYEHGGDVTSPSRFRQCISLLRYGLGAHTCGVL